MTAPEHHDSEDDPITDQVAPEQIPPAGPAYSTPPTEGLPDADDDG